MDVAMIFAGRLRQRRCELGLTQKELGARLGYSEKTVSKWESGRSVCPSISLPELAVILKTDVNSLLTDESEGEYFLGIDGGGTKTDFVLADANGKILSHVTLGASNPNDIGMRATRELLAKGISEVIGDLPTSRISAFFGIAGGTSGDNRDRLREFLSKYGFKSFDNGNDAECAVAAALGGGDGCVVIVGTGSAAFTQTDGALGRRGGFGYLFEEGGSGYAVGRDAVMHALRLEERGACVDKLTSLIRARLGKETVTECLSELYSGGKRLIASLAEEVVRAYKLGDESAEGILRENMRCVAGLIESSYEAFGEAARRVVLVGGLIAECESFLPYIINNLKDKDKYHVSVSKAPPYTGALLLARRTYA